MASREDEGMERSFSFIHLHPNSSSLSDLIASIEFSCSSTNSPGISTCRKKSLETCRQEILSRKNSSTTDSSRNNSDDSSRKVFTDFSRRASSDSSRKISGDSLRKNSSGSDSSRKYSIDSLCNDSIDSLRRTRGGSRKNSIDSLQKGGSSSSGSSRKNSTDSYHRSSSQSGQGDSPGVHPRLKPVHFSISSSEENTSENESRKSFHGGNALSSENDNGGFPRRNNAMTSHDKSKRSLSATVNKNSIRPPDHSCSSKDKFTSLSPLNNNNSPTKEAHMSLPPETRRGSLQSEGKNNGVPLRSPLLRKFSQEIASAVEALKMSGYLEKRSKVLGWKRFWFVLDGRLLTYYKSKSEYESLSACSGSVNLGIATNVSPIRASKGYPLQIVTRTQVYYLRAGDKAQLDRWLIAIQEAATIPPSISLPYWTDPGIQFYNYTFQALSQCSLNASTDDLSSVPNVPKNFYRPAPSSLLKKCHSFASLNFNLNTSSLFGSSSGPKGLSGSQNSGTRSYWDISNEDFLSQSYNTYHSTLGYKSTRKVKGKRRSKSEDKADKDNRQSESIMQRNNKTNLSKMRHTSSMLVLESSPQAGELRRELARKLSIPSTLRENTGSSPNSAQHNVTPSAGQSRPVPVKAPRQSKLTATGTPPTRHPLGNIYSNCQESFPHTPSPLDTHEDILLNPQHDYDEILDLDPGIYEPCGLPQAVGTSSPTEGIYENVGESHKMSRQAQNPKISQIMDDPWEKLPPSPRSSRVGGSESACAMSAKNRRSLHSRDSGSGRNSLVSIAEMPEKESVPKRSSRNLEGMLGEAGGSPGDASKIQYEQYLWERGNSDKDSDSGASEASKGYKRKGTKRHTITGFFQKIFTKGEKNKKRGGDSPDGREMVISRPVEVRKIPREDSARSMSSNKSSRSTLSRATSSSEESSGGHSQSKVLPHLRGLKPAVGANFSSSEDLLQELNKKIGERKTCSALMQSQAPEMTSVTPPVKNERLSRKTGGPTSEFGVDREEKRDRHSTVSLSTFQSGHKTLPPRYSAPASSSSAAMTEYQRKLDQFNRLSASLTPSFSAVLSRPHHHPLYRDSPTTNHLGSNGSAKTKVIRSRSCRVRSMSEEPPLLPPKMKQAQKVNLYDVPMNNKPVESSILLRLQKKNSAPDIPFSSLPPHWSMTLPGGEGSSSNLFRNSFDRTTSRDFNSPTAVDYENNNFPGQSVGNTKSSNAPVPPPRPPKPDLASTSSLQAISAPKTSLAPPTGTTPYVNVKPSSLSKDFRPPRPEKPKMKRENLQLKEDPIPPSESSDEVQSEEENNPGEESTAKGEEKRLEKINSDAPDQDAALEKDSITAELIPDEPCEGSAIISLRTTTVAPATSLQAQVLEIPEMLMISTSRSPTCSNTSGDIDNLEILSDARTAGSSSRSSFSAGASSSSSASASASSASSRSSSEPTSPTEVSQASQSLCHEEMSEESPLEVDVIPEERNSSPSPYAVPEGKSPLPTIVIEMDDQKIEEEVEDDSIPCETILIPPAEADLDGQEESERRGKAEGKDKMELDVQGVKKESEVDETVLVPLPDLTSAQEDSFDDGSHFYDDVPFESPIQIHYAKIQSVPWETVEETEEEIYELYDEFPADPTYCPPAVATSLATSTASSMEMTATRMDSVLCHYSSGMEELQEYLDGEEEHEEEKSGDLRRQAAVKRNPAVSRLGHSSAIEQLKKITGSSAPSNSQLGDGSGESP